MEPIPETVKAIEELGPFANEADLLDDLKRMGSEVTDLVPDCVGMSLASAEHGVTFTLIASERQLAFINAIQDLVETMEEASRPEPQVDEIDSDLLDEETWHLLAMATAARCIVSTLTLPIVKDDAIAGAVSLYGASRQAFTGHYEQLAIIFGAWAPGAVTNADLSFSTRRDAEEAPDRLQNESTVGQAAHIVAQFEGVTLGAAYRRIREAADRAGISEEQLAEAVIRLRRRPG
jgi:transcriptional regulator with GAF, ATPase, and Fis domain